MTPLAIYLVSEACQLTHEIFDVGGGRYARIFIGMTPGLGEGRGPAGDRRGDRREHRQDPRHAEGYVIPDSIAGEMQAVAKALQGQG